MTINKLASLIAKKEGKKSQARIGDIREILAILSDIFWEEDVELLMAIFLANGLKRAKKTKRVTRRKA